MEVMNILETKAYESIDEEKVPVKKNWLGREGLQLIKHSQMKGKNARLQKNYFLC